MAVPWDVLETEVAQRLPSWRIEISDDVDNMHYKRVELVRDFEFESFEKAMSFIDTVAKHATEIDHHPSSMNLLAYRHGLAFHLGCGTPDHGARYSAGAISRAQIQGILIRHGCGSRRGYCGGMFACLITLPQSSRLLGEEFRRLRAALGDRLHLNAARLLDEVRPAEDLVHVAIDPVGERRPASAAAPPWRTRSRRDSRAAVSATVGTSGSSRTRSVGADRRRS